VCAHVGSPEHFWGTLGPAPLGWGGRSLLERWGLASWKGDVQDPLQTRQAVRAYTCRAEKAGPLTSCLPGSLGVIRTDTDRSGIRYDFYDSY